MPTRRRTLTESFFPTLTAKEKQHTAVAIVAHIQATSIQDRESTALEAQLRWQYRPTARPQVKMLPVRATGATQHTALPVRDTRARRRGRQ